MIISPAFLEILIFISIAMSAVAPVVLAVLFYRDWKKKRLW